VQVNPSSVEGHPGGAHQVLGVGILYYQHFASHVERVGNNLIVIATMCTTQASSLPKGKHAPIVVRSVVSDYILRVHGLFFYDLVT